MTERYLDLNGTTLFVDDHQEMFFHDAAGRERFEQLMGSSSHFAHHEQPVQYADVVVEFVTGHPR